MVVDKGRRPACLILRSVRHLASVQPGSQIWHSHDRSDAKREGGVQPATSEYLMMIYTLCDENIWKSSRMVKGLLY